MLPFERRVPRPTGRAASHFVLAHSTAAVRDLCDGVSGSPANYDTIITRILEDRFSSGYIAVRDGCQEVAQAKLREARPLQAMVIPWATTPADDECISTDYPEFNIVSRASRRIPHALSATAIYLTRERIMAYIQPNHRDVIDIGGDICDHLARARHRVHVCRPVSTPLDESRYMSTSFDADKLASAGRKPLHLASLHSDYLRDRAKYACPVGKAQNCTVKGHVLIMNHVDFDCPLEQVALSAFRHGCDEIYGYFAYSPRMFSDNSGKLTHIGGHFTRDDVHNELKIVYPGDSMRRQSFKLSRYLKLMTTHYIEVANRRYTYELRSVGANMAIYYMVDITGAPFPEQVLRHFVWELSDEERMVITAPVLRAGAADVWSRASYDERTFSVPKRDYEKGLQFALALPQKRMTREVLYDRLYAICNTTVDHGTAIVHHEAVPVEDVVLLSLCVFTKAFEMRYFSQSVVNTYTHQTRKLRTSNKLGIARMVVAASVSLPSIFGDVGRLRDWCTRKLSEDSLETFAVPAPRAMEFSTLIAAHVEQRNAEQPLAGVRLFRTFAEGLAGFDIRSLVTSATKLRSLVSRLSSSGAAQLSRRFRDNLGYSLEEAMSDDSHESDDVAPGLALEEESDDEEFFESGEFSDRDLTVCAIGESTGPIESGQFVVLSDNSVAEEAAHEKFPTAVVVRVDLDNEIPESPKYICLSGWEDRRFRALAVAQCHERLAGALEVWFDYSASSSMSVTSCPTAVCDRVVMESGNLVNTLPSLEMPLTISRVHLSEGPDSYARPNPSADPRGDLQEVYDQVFPGHSLHSTDTNTAMVHNSDLNVSINARRLAVDASKLGPLKSQPVRKALLRTAMTARRPQTLIETLLAVVKRNLDVPKLDVLMANEEVVQATFDSLLRQYFVPGAEQKMRLFEENPIRLDAAAVNVWLARLKPGTLATVENHPEYFDVNLKNLESYELMIKADAKPKCEQGASEEYQALQTIVCHTKDANALFSPLFMELRERLRTLLKPNVLINMQKSPTQIEAFLQEHEDFDVDLNYVENDFSKFDKSQQHVCLNLEWEFYRRMGLSIEDAMVWEEGHRKCEMSAVQVGIKLSSYYQRRSGDATTALGNTLVNMMSVSAIYDVPNFKYAMFLGDDSIIATYKEIDASDATLRMAGVYNLSAKVLQSPYGFFCSCFIVKHGGTVRYMPDPVKRTMKLGAHASCNTQDELRERFISFRDLVRNYDSQAHNLALIESVQKRYNCPQADIGVMIDALYTLSTSEEEYMKMYDPDVSIIDG